MKIYNLDPLLYTYKLEFGIKIPIELNIKQDRNSFCKFFIASNIIKENSKVIDVTDTSDSIDFNIYKIDNSNIDKIDLDMRINSDVYVCKYNRLSPSHGEILNTTEQFGYRNNFNNLDISEFRIKTVRPDIMLDENKLYIPVVIKEPLNGMIYSTNKIPTCYINFYDKEIFVYNPAILRFYNQDSTNYHKIIYPPIFLGPYLKGVILDNMKYISYYKEWRFNLLFTQSLFNHLGGSILSSNSMLSYKITYIMSNIVKKLFEKYIIEIIFVLPIYDVKPS